jgi:Family of unknown function (DUF5343)
MALTDVYVQVYGQLPDFFSRIAQGQAPPRFTRQYLKDLGFTSANFNAVIPLLKAMGFLEPDGTPTERYHRYRDGSQARRVMTDGLREAYGDLFLIKADPSDADRPLIEGKFKSTHNATDRVAKLMANTFFALLPLADLSGTSQAPASPAAVEPMPQQSPAAAQSPSSAPLSPTLHYNIQIHLPATKDVEVYNAIFKSLKEHLLG